MLTIRKNQNIVGYLENSDLPKSEEKAKEILKKNFGSGRFRIDWYDKNKRAPHRRYYLIKDNNVAGEVVKEGLSVQEVDNIREAINNLSDRVENRLERNQNDIEKKLSAFEERVEEKIKRLESKSDEKDVEHEEKLEDVLKQVSQFQSMFQKKE